LCYIVLSTSSRHVLAENNVYANIIDDIVQIRHTFGENMCSFMLLGDRNSRVGNLHDNVLNDNCSLHDINLLPDDYDIDNVIPRKSYDTGTNSNGYLLIDFLSKLDYALQMVEFVTMMELIHMFLQYDAVLLIIVL